MNPEALDVYLLCAAALTFNLGLLVFLTGAGRTKTKVFTIPEDAETFKGECKEKEAPSVQRAIAAHRNALENIPMFLILGFLHVATGATKTSALAYFVTFTVARWFHTLAYLRSMQPWRTLSFSVGFLAMMGVAARLMITALT